MADLAVGLAVFGLGLVMCLWAHDKIWPNETERKKLFAWGILLFGILYLVLGVVLS
jgi:hypothetical protein